MNEMTLSLVLPVRDNAINLTHVVLECMAVVPLHFADYEIIVVDDGSRDTTPTLADDLAASYDPVMVIHHARPHGYARALFSGWSVARGDYILCLDTSGEVSISELERLVPFIGRYDIVIGYTHRQGFRTRFANRLFALDLYDLEHQISVFRSTLRQRLPVESSGAAAYVELYVMAYRARATVQQVEVSSSGRTHHGSLERGPSLRELIRLWRRLRRAPAAELYELRPFWQQRTLWGTVLAALIAGLWLLRRRHVPKR